MYGQDRVGAIVVAAGQSTRFGRDKLFEQLLDRPVLWWSLDAMNRSPEVDEIVLVTSKLAVSRCEALCAELSALKPLRVVVGGVRRQDSVRCGLDALGPCQWVLVHDGARPLVAGAMISAGLEAVRRTGAAVPGVRLADTVKQVTPDGLVAATPDRSLLRAIQTPQVFAFDVLACAHREVADDVTDDAAMVEAIGGHVVVFPGDAANVKVTNAHDLCLCEALLRSKMA